jgi:hypothetical protein
MKGFEMRLVYGVGTNDLQCDNEHYGRWRNMLERCYVPNCQQKHPTYVGSSVCPEWKLFSNFNKWAEQFQWEGMHLDKDLLAPEKTGKMYCPEFCVPIPPWLNLLFTDHRAARGQFAQGVYFDKHRQNYQSNLKVNGRLQHLGRFATEQEAAQFYLTAKKLHVQSKYPQIKLLHRGEEIITSIERKYFQ